MPKNLWGVKKIENIDEFVYDLFLCENKKISSIKLSSKWNLTKRIIEEIILGVYELTETLSDEEIYSKVMSKTKLTKRQIQKFTSDYSITEIYYGWWKNNHFVPNENHKQDPITIRQKPLLTEIYTKLENYREVLRNKILELGKEKFKQKT